MEKHDKIPAIDGLYWYFEQGKDPRKPEPVSIVQERYGAGTFKGFNGRTQSWMRKDEYLIGPQLPPAVDDIQPETQEQGLA